MATEGPLDRWYVGEHKVLRWTTRDRKRAVVPITGWNVAVRIYRRRAAMPLVSIPAVVVDGENGIVAAEVSAAMTAAWGPGSYRVLCVRIDPGTEQVIAAEDFSLLPQGE